jgi:RNA recognition motif-containing protein
MFKNREIAFLLEKRLCWLARLATHIKSQFIFFRFSIKNDFQVVSNYVGNFSSKIHSAFLVENFRNFALNKAIEEPHNKEKGFAFINFEFF